MHRLFCLLLLTYLPTRCVERSFGHWDGDTAQPSGEVSGASDTSHTADLTAETDMQTSDMKPPADAAEATPQDDLAEVDDASDLADSGGLNDGFDGAEITPPDAGDTAETQQPEVADPCSEEKLDYLDNDCDGKVDEVFRTTLFRRQGSNQIGYRNPSADGDHCFSTAQNGVPWCVVGHETTWAEYGFDGFQMQVYAGFNNEGDFLEVGGYPLVRLGACFNETTNEHQYWTVDSNQYASLSAPGSGWECSKQLGFVRTGIPIGKDTTELAVRRHVHMLATDTMYSATESEGSSIGFVDKGVAWFAWSLP